MIETLVETRKIVKYGKKLLVKFYDNSDNEDYPPHSHDSIEIIMPIENGYTVICGDFHHHLRAGDVLVIQPNLLHSMPAIPGRRLICQASLLPNYSQTRDARKFPPTILLTPERDKALLTNVQQQLYDVQARYQSFGLAAELSLYINFLQILQSIFLVFDGNHACMADQPHGWQEHNNRLKTICEYINCHYQDKLTLEEMAKKSGYSKYHFERLFKQSTSESFYQYLNRVRIMKAEQLINHTNISIADVASRCGFRTLSSFYRSFRIKHGCTPAEYRR